MNERPTCGSCPHRVRYRDSYGCARDTPRGVVVGDTVLAAAMNKILEAGRIYKRPDGSYVRVLQTGGGLFASFADAQGKESVVSAANAASTWQLCPYLRDFPDAADPRLPYEFDLHWDVHTLGQLRAEGVEAHHRELAAGFGIDLDDPDTVRAYNLRYAQWNEDNPLDAVLATLQRAFPRLTWEQDAVGYFYALNSGVSVLRSRTGLHYRVDVCGGLLVDERADTLADVVQLLKAAGPRLVEKATILATAFESKEKPV